MEDTLFIPTASLLNNINQCHNLEYGDFVQSTV